VVEADLKEGRATAKGSCARNLHRLMLTITFVRLLLKVGLKRNSRKHHQSPTSSWLTREPRAASQQLYDNRAIQLKDALWTAYKASRMPRPAVQSCAASCVVGGSWCCTLTVRCIRTACYRVQGSLHPIHTYLLQTAVWTGLVTVPMRQTFLTSIGEDEASARQHVPEVVAAAEAVVGRLEALFADTAMPISDVTTIPTAPPVAAAQ
jgi:hypothetical protein